MNKIDQEKSLNNWKYLLPISLIVFFVPLIVFMKVVKLTPIEIEYWKGGTDNSDFFAYYKMIALSVFTTLSMVCGYLYIKKENIKLKIINIYIPMAIYSYFIIFSTITSKYKGVALFGFTDRYEGMIVLISYLIIMLITINMVGDEKSIKMILYPLIVSATIIAIIGVFQYIGYDFFQTSFGKKMVLPLAYRHIADSLQFAFGKNTIYSTLYNTNYVGSYMTMIFSILFTILILIKGIKKKIILIPLTILMFVNLIGSNSRGGMLGTAFAILILLIILRKMIIKNWKIILISVISLSIGFIYINKVSDGMVISQLNRLKSDIENIFVESEINPNEYKVKELIAKDNTLKIVTTLETITMLYEEEDLMFLDENNDIIDIAYNIEDGRVDLSNEKYKDYQFNFLNEDGLPVLDLTLRGYHSSFIIKDGQFKYYDRYKSIRAIKKVESFGFEGKETLGSGRGYIWSRSIPLLKKNIVYGGGPDTYIMQFPQNDFVGRSNIPMYRGNIVVDKPHNLYLQIGINTGVISLLAFLAIVLMYSMQSFKAYFNSKFENIYQIVGLSIFIGICGYMVAGIFNDSVISVAPVFWVLLGTGVAVNMKVLEKED